ncbi:MAG: hypothetical protein AAGA60_31495 [Cyanobacteria bacterium P01_E01_bin.42]
MNPCFLKPTLELFPEPLPAKVTVKIGQNQPGRVAFNSSYYPAKLYGEKARSLLPDDPCYIIGREGITLLAIAPSPIPENQKSKIE